MQFQFWSSESLQSFEGEAIATKDKTLSYNDLNNMVDEYSTFLSDKAIKNQLAFLPMRTDIDSVVRYLACLRNKIVPILFPCNIDEGLIENLKKIYNPPILFGLKFDEIEFNSKAISKNSLPENLAILLSTSGSTGSSKLVKLSHDNLHANASSISKYLNIQSSSKAHCSLPLSYSYGLSVLNSHLQSGACTYLSELNPLSTNYYDELIEENITSISGVPFFYQMLFRTGFLNYEFPSLKVMTQAGGRLNDKLIEKFNIYANQNNLDFYIMYGQTEATARISYVPPKMLAKKIGSIGIPIPGGGLSLSDEGELVYSGPNVMLGYAENISDLSNKNPPLNNLLTGDIATKDEDGFYYITGRLKRFVKLAGSRFSLDEIEIFLENKFDHVFLVTGVDDKLIIITECLEYNKSSIMESLQSKYSISRGFIKVKYVNKITRTPNGKKDYTSYLNNSYGK